MIRTFIAYIAVIALFAYSPAQARESVLDIQSVTSPGGITAWLVEDHSVPIVAFNFTFKGIGSKLEPADKQGLVRMLSNTMDEGAGDLESKTFQKELQDLSITLRFNAGRDSFGGTVKTLSKNKARAFELLTLALTQPRFDDEPLNRMRAANQTRVRSALSDPNWIAARIMNDRVFDDHPYAQNSGGTLSTLDHITADDLRAFHKNLSKDRLIVSVSGDVTKEELSTLLDQVFGPLPQSAAVQDVADLTPQNLGQTYIYKKNIPQSVVSLRQAGIKRSDPRYETAQIMNFILGSSGFGSRLTKEIREKRGLTYGIYSYFNDMKHTALMGVSTSTKNGSVGEMLSLIKAEWVKMKKQPVTDEELETAKSYLIGSLPLSLTSTGAIAGVMTSLQYDDLPIDYLDQRSAKIQAVTVEGIQELSQTLLTPDQLLTVIVGQPAAIPGATYIETLPNAE